MFRERLLSDMDATTFVVLCLPPFRSKWFGPHYFRSHCACFLSLPVGESEVSLPLSGCCHTAIMLSHSRCLTRNFSRSLSALRQVGSKQIMCVRDVPRKVPPRCPCLMMRAELMIRPTSVSISSPVVAGHGQALTLWAKDRRTPSVDSLCRPCPR